MQHLPLLRSYREHERELVRFLARRLRCVVTAHDLLHDLYVKLHDLAPGAEVRHEKAYLFRMAANLAADHLRNGQRRSELAAEAHTLLCARDEQRTPERAAAAREELEAMRQVVAGLPPLSRRIFGMNRFEGRTQREIAAEVGVSVTTVENHIRKVLALLAAARGGRPGEES